MILSHSQSTGFRSLRELNAQPRFEVTTREHGTLTVRAPNAVAAVIAVEDRTGEELPTGSARRIEESQ